MMSAYWRIRQTKFVRSFLKPQLIKTSPQKRSSYHYLPPSQYDWGPLPWTLRPLKASRVFYEIIPIIMTSTFSLAIAVLYIANICVNKLDISWSHNGRDFKNRTMNLCHPVCYKFITINQKYLPWPEMQRVLDKMNAAETKLIAKASTCPLEDHVKDCDAERQKIKDKKKKK